MTGANDANDDGGAASSIQELALMVSRYRGFDVVVAASMPSVVLYSGKEKLS